MVGKFLLIAGAGTLLIGGAALATPAVASPTTPHTHAQGYPPPAVRIAATNKTYNAIEKKIATGKSLFLFFPDPTAQVDVIDYGVQNLWKKGIDGAGVTVAEVVTNPDPDLSASMTVYDKAMTLPPAHVTQMALPAPSNKSFTCQVECSPGEDQLDAEAIHSMAPYANILFVHPSIPETIGIQGWPQVAKAIEDIANRHLADIITVSLGDGEKDFIKDPTNPGSSQQAAIRSLDAAFLDAAAHNIPVMFAAGDCGPTAPTVLSDTGQCTPTVGLTADHPADNPWVTAVGGTIPNAGLATKGGRTAPDALWTAAGNDSDATSAGISTIYAKPWYQAGVKALAGVKGRSFPDIAMDSDDGTSQASPTFAGILALATQVRGRSLGFVNPALYAMGPHGTADGIVDVPAGYTDTAYGVTGYKTGPGFDIASGWGTIYAPNFVPALVKEIDMEHGLAARAAQFALFQLQSNIRESAFRVDSGVTVTVTGKGFIPGRSPNGTKIKDGIGVFPYLPGQYGAPPGGPFVNPNSKVPGQTWDTVTATLTGPKLSSARSLAVSGPNGNGTVTVHVNTKGLAAGIYRVTITGMLLTQTIAFMVK